jgi:hypothetical protein
MQNGTMVDEEEASVLFVLISDQASNTENYSMVDKAQGIPVARFLCLCHLGLDLVR